MGDIIRIEHLTFRYLQNTRAAISNLTGDITCDGIIAIIGASGVGKSTLLRLMSGVYRKSDRWIGEYEGEIRLRGRRPHELLGPQQVSLMAQSPVLLNHLTVKRNVFLPCELIAKSDKEEWNRRYQELREALDLSLADERKRPTELSGGMRTRAALARAIISHPQYLFLDEPFSSLDLFRRWALYKIIRQVRSRSNLTTILTTHDLWEAVILANRIVFLNRENKGTTVSSIENDVPVIETCSITECLHFIQPKVEEIIQRLGIGERWNEIVPGSVQV